MKTLRAILAATLVTAPTLRAQLVNDGASVTLANVATNITGTVTVGTNGPFTLLTLSDNALVTNSLNGVIGRNSTARSNEVRLISPTARWQMGTTLSIGSTGAFNRLVIDNGAQVVGTFAGNTAILGETAASTNNFALVTGAGSLWSNAGSINIGSFGARNQLVISNGGRFHSANQSYLGLASSSTNNRVTVTGAGSVWSSDGGINVGLNGRGNALEVRAGGGLRDASGFIGEGSGGFNLANLAGPGTFWTNTSEFHVGSGSSVNHLLVNNGAVVFAGSLGLIGRASVASSNTVTVSDPGSMWVNGGELYVGRDGAANRLDVNNGGTVTASNLFVGVQPSSTNNRVVVDGGTLRVSSPAGNSTLEVRRGTNVLNAGLIDVDFLMLTNFFGRFEFNGGTLVTRGARMTNGSGMVLGLSGTTPAVWEVRPGLSDHKVSLGVSVGQVTPLNQLNITGGASLSNGVGGFIGLGASSNAATVSGPGSRWQVAGDVFPGAGGAFNRLTVEAGGRVQDVAGRMLTSSNVALVTGLGSLWSNATSVTVGETGSGNQLQVNDGGLVVAGSGIIGQAATASANTAQITGAGSEWRIFGNLNVGSGGALNQLQVSGGAHLSDFSGIIGGTATGSSNSAVVSGPGSLWNNSSAFTVGSGGDHSELVVSDGGMVAAPFSGVGDSSAHNVAVVTGSGSVWSNDFNLNVGFFGHSNRVRIENGAFLVSGKASIGETGRSNEVSLTGTGSLWNNPGDLTVGVTGQRNRLVMSDGATALTGGDARIGENAGGSSNAVVTAGPGARWQVTSNLFVGEHGAFNSMVVSNGAFVSDDTGFVGREFDASNNLALITGPGSVWSNASQAHVGRFSADNQLIVSDGATLVSRGGFIGLGGVGNFAMVAGPGSKWDAGQSLFMEYENNRLVISNAALVINDTGHIGEGDGNTATVIGAGSLWSNRLELTVGGSGSANRLNIQSGGTVFGGKVFVGRGDSSTNNRVVVQNGTLRATNATGTGVLDVRRGTNVLNSGLVDVDNLVLTNKGTPTITRFTNGFGTAEPVILPNQSGPANPYPSTIAVAGLTGVVTKVTVTLTNLHHVQPDDMDILLVGPAGQKVMLMSDAGDSVGILSVSLTFDDSAPALLPDGAQISGGTYRPTDYEIGDIMPAPAPPGPYSAALTSFDGGSPNGNWTLYVADDNAGGNVSSASLLGWGLQIETDPGRFSDAGTFELNGGMLITRGAVISNGLPFIVGGPGGVLAVWEARAGLSDNFVARDLLVGSASSRNQLVIPSGVVSAGTNVIVGASSVSSNNLLHVTGGTLRALTPGAALDVRGGTNRFDAGLVDVARLIVTNARGQFEFNGGTLRTSNTVIANARVFTVGGGASTATLQLLGGTHTFANNLTIATNGSLIGTGVIDGTVTVSPGGRLTPGAPIGSIDVLGSVILQGTVTLQIDKSGGVRTNDQVTADGAIFYSGTLNVSDIGADLLTAGDRFFLFDATPYIGAFTTLNLPPLQPGLAWQNNLSVDGSIEVIAAGGQPGITSIIRSGTNIVFAGTNGPPNANYTVLAATNVALPASNWTSIATRQFDAGGGFSFTNAIAPGIPQRFFRLRTP